MKILNARRKSYACIDALMISIVAGIFSTKNPDKNAKILPVQTPINKAGEKIPPNKPSLIQTTVKKSFPIKRKTNLGYRYWEELKRIASDIKGAQVGDFFF